MADQEKNSANEAGQAGTGQETETKTTQETQVKEASTGEVTQVLEIGQGHKVTAKDYTELQTDHGKKSQAIKDLEKENEDLREFKSRTEQAVGSPKPSSNGQKKTPTDLRREAQAFRDEGYEYNAEELEYRANSIEEKEEENRDKAKGQEFDSLLAEISKDDNPIDPKQVDWEKVGKIATAQNLSPRAAFGQWVASNLKTLNEAVVQKELETRELAGGAITHEDGGMVEPESEDAELTAFRRLIGPPGSR